MSCSSNWRYLALAVFFDVVTIIMMGSCGSVPQPRPEAPPQCMYTREFITALEFLRDQKQFKISETEMKSVATRVADGCTNAAERFVRVTNLLAASGVTARNALQMGEKFALRSDVETETFVVVFKTTFFAENLDMDLRSALTLAQSLSTEFEGDKEGIREDFLKLAKYCVDSSALGLPKPQCAYFAARVARLGAVFGGKVAGPFVEVYEYLRSDRGPKLIASEALKKAEELISTGPIGSENFISAYLYATNTKGMALSRNDAINFASRMASVGYERAIASIPKEIKSEQK